MLLDMWETQTSRGNDADQVLDVIIQKEASPEKPTELVTASVEVVGEAPNVTSEITFLPNPLIRVLTLKGGAASSSSTPASSPCPGASTASVWGYLRAKPRLSAMLPIFTGNRPAPFFKMTNSGSVSSTLLLSQKFNLKISSSTTTLENYRTIVWKI